MTLLDAAYQLYALAIELQEAHERSLSVRLPYEGETIQKVGSSLAQLIDKKVAISCPLWTFYPNGHIELGQYNLIVNDDWNTPTVAATLAKAAEIARAKHLPETPLTPEQLQKEIDKATESAMPF